ncbi:hypothetical protein K431DRAFT_310643 [Polychaeton citri CBS 116435]|uniref:Uncharacterized protein n=1 Tax=Polychaeton citri CBS 116435 TaxID=1314669 RepID=A0A9P4QFH3_9PEZI|nr:hypothetical protein K431DRAFT_310643 [Polychaeton citri CBS 116435]
MHIRNLTFAALAGAASAVPAPQSDSVLDGQPPENQEFALAMTVDGTDTYVSLNAVSNGTLGNLVLQTQRLSVYPGTPAYFNGSAADGMAALNFDLTDSTDEYNKGVFGLHAPDVGDNYGYSTPVSAIYGFQEFAWGSYNGTITHNLNAALEDFFSCEGVINGEKASYLAWGVYQSNGEAPEGCAVTNLVKNCNVEGGATDC